MAGEKTDEKTAREGAGGAEPSSHETCGQFPADEVAATHEGEGLADPKKQKS